MSARTIPAAALAAAMILLAPAPAAATDPVYTGCLTKSGKIVRLKLGDLPKRGKCTRKTTQVRLEAVDMGGVTISWDVKLKLGELFSTPDGEVIVDCYQEASTTVLDVRIFDRWQGEMYSESIGRLYHFEDAREGVWKASGDAYTGSIEAKYPCGSEGYVVVFNQED